jgi:hypothetical protein
VKLLDGYYTITVNLLAALFVSSIMNVFICSGKRSRIQIVISVTSISILIVSPPLVSYLKTMMETGSRFDPWGFIYAMMNVFTPKIPLSSAFVITLLSFWAVILFALAKNVFHYYSSASSVDDVRGGTRPPFVPRRADDVFHHFYLCVAAFIICVYKLVMFFNNQHGIDEYYALMRIGLLFLNGAFCIIGGFINTQISIQRTKTAVLAAGSLFSDLVGLSIIFVNCGI